MARRQVGWRGYGLTVEMPDPAAARLRSLREQAQRLGGRGGQPTAPPPEPRPGLLEIAPCPPLHLRARDPQAAISFLAAGASTGPDVPAPAAATARDGDREQTLAEQVAARPWYHTLELPGGIVTPGDFDHRELVAHYGLPSDLTGKTALDVATFDGFWAFELERRGAAVTAADLDSAADIDFPVAARQALEASGMRDGLVPVGGGFALAHRALGSSVTRVATSVYDLDPSTHGRFDFVHVADLLLHLRSPVAALAAIRSVTAGEALIVDCYDPQLSTDAIGPPVHYLGGWHDVTWWLPSLDALAQMVLDAGFRTVDLHLTYRLARRFETDGYWRAALRAAV